LAKGKFVGSWGNFSASENEAIAKRATLRKLLATYCQCKYFVLIFVDDKNNFPCGPDIFETSKVAL